MIDAIVFDKDGTLFDFRAVWGAWTADMIDHLTKDPQKRRFLDDLLGFERAKGDFAKDSIVIGHTTFEIAVVLHPHVAETGLDVQGLTSLMSERASVAPLVPAVDLPLVLGDLRARNLRLGLATNDTEAPAWEHLKRAGVDGLFDFVAGSDSGWGGKPAPGQLLAFVAALGLDPARVAMVGDSLHDLHAGQAAGMKRVAVLTGIAKREELAPHADVVLDDISHLAEWLDEQAAFA